MENKKINGKLVIRFIYVLILSLLSVVIFNKYSFYVHENYLENVKSNWVQTDAKVIDFKQNISTHKVHAKILNDVKYEYIVDNKKFIGNGKTYKFLIPYEGISENNIVKVYYNPKNNSESTILTSYDTMSIFSIFMVIIFIGILLGIVYLYKKTQYLEKNGIYIDADIIEVFEDGKKVKISYNGFKKDLLNTRGWKIGDKVKIIYDSKNPKSIIFDKK